MSEPLDMSPEVFVQLPMRSGPAWINLFSIDVVKGYYNRPGLTTVTTRAVDYDIVLSHEEVMKRIGQAFAEAVEKDEQR